MAQEKAAVIEAWSHYCVATERANDNDDPEKEDLVFIGTMFFDNKLLTTRDASGVKYEDLKVPATAGANIKQMIRRICEKLDLEKQITLAQKQQKELQHLGQLSQMSDI